MNHKLIFFFLLVCNAVFAQPEKAVKETINGKKYYIHTVKPGNTMWWIHENYNVPVEDISAANPGSEKGVSVGQRILVPVPIETIDYTVLPKETLYAISKKFEVTVESIVLSNPNSDNGVQVGQILHIEGVDRDVAARVLKTPNSTAVTEVAEKKEVVKTEVVKSQSVKEVKTNETIPVVKSDTLPAQKKEVIKIPQSDTIIDHIVKDNETLYTLSKRYMISVNELQKTNHLKSTRIKPGDVVKIQIKKVDLKQPEIRQVESATAPIVDSMLLFPAKSSYKIALLLPFQLDKTDANSEYISGLATEFYMGTKLALDSLKKFGLNAEVYVYDIKNDTNQTKKILNKSELKGLDLVIGPFFPENADVVAKWCKLNKVRMVCPVLLQPSILKGNPYVYNTVPSDADLMDVLAKHTLNNYSSEQIVLIKPVGEKDQLLYDAFRNSFLTSAIIGNRPKLIETTIDNYLTFVKKDVRTILVFPTNDKLQMVKFMNSANSNSSKMNADLVSVYGTKEWLTVDEIKPQFKNKFHFHYASPNDLNYKNYQTQSLLKKYRKTYNADLTKMSVQGFDVTYHFCSILLMGMDDESRVMNQFIMNQKGVGNGFQNTNGFVLEQRDFELIRAGE
ncbi:MAG: LysM peptidoglycan-binding domain-containing protein [Flavobacteriia bacterium]|jgi:LysM repeat protein